MARTYLPTLIRVLHQVCTYITRYRAVIITHLGSEQIAMLDGVLAACKLFTDNVQHQPGD